MARKYSSTAVETTLSAGINTAATSISVGSVTNWPTSPSVSAPYTIIIDPDTVDEEVCEVTAASGTSLTVVRAVDGTTAKSHNMGAVVKHGVSARDFSDSQNHIDATTAHGATGGVVGESKTQTLSNKSIDATANTITNISNASVAAGAAIAASKIAGTAVTQADTGTVTNAMLAGSIANAKLANSSVTIGGATATLGGSNVTSVTGMVLDATSTVGGVSGTRIGSINTNWSGAWTAYTPTVTGFTNVTTTTTGYYKYLSEKTVAVKITVTLGTVTALGSTGIAVSLPVSASSTGMTSGLSVLGNGLRISGSGGSPVMVVAVYASSSNFNVLVDPGSSANLLSWTGSQPSGQVTSDKWTFSLCYETA